jgi:hypothetical protein
MKKKPSTMSAAYELGYNLLRSCSSLSRGVTEVDADVSSRSCARKLSSTEDNISWKSNSKSASSNQTSSMMPFSCSKNPRTRPFLVVHLSHSVLAAYSQALPNGLHVSGVRARAERFDLKRGCAVLPAWPRTVSNTGASNDRTTTSAGVVYVASSSYAAQGGCRCGISLLHVSTRS